MPLRNDMIAVYVARPGEKKSHEFLQLRRRAGDYLGGTWSTVYGGVEVNETAWQAAARELREETAIIATELYRVPTVRSFYTSINDTTWIVPAFCAVVERDINITLNDEHTEFRWVKRDHVERDFYWPTDCAAIAEIVTEILSPQAKARQHLRIDLPR